MNLCSSPSQTSCEYIGQSRCYYRSWSIPCWKLLIPFSDFWPWIHPCRTFPFNLELEEECPWMPEKWTAGSSFSARYFTAFPMKPTESLCWDQRREIFLCGLDCCQWKTNIALVSLKAPSFICELQPSGQEVVVQPVQGCWTYPPVAFHLGFQPASDKWSASALSHYIS